MYERRRTFVLDEPTAVPVLPEGLEDIRVGVNVLVTKQLLDVLRRLLAVVYDEKKSKTVGEYVDKATTTTDLQNGILGK